MKTAQRGFPPGPIARRFGGGWLLLLCGLVGPAVVIGCGSGPASPASSATGGGAPERRGAASSLEDLPRYDGPYPIRAVATTGMVADLVRAVGGRHVEVRQLMGEGVDPHQYQAPPSDITALSRADVIFYSGLHLEGKLADIFARLARRTPTFPVTAGLPEARLLEVEDGYYDPHVWFDVALWSEAAGYVADVLSRFDPPHAADYTANAAAYRETLAALDDWVREQVATIPADRRVLVTAHDAFHYFGRAYGLQVKAIQGVSTESEAGLKTINALVDYLVEQRIPAVFVETSVPERAVRALVDGAAARGHRVVIGGELFSDAMGAPGTPEGTYEGMVRHNVRTIVDALK